MGAEQAAAIYVSLDAVMTSSTVICQRCGNLLVKVLFGPLRGAKTIHAQGRLLFAESNAQVRSISGAAIATLLG